MKRNVARLVIATLVCLIFGSIPVLADGTGIPPLCMPGRPCPQAPQQK
jgi:hypothetical protein